MSKLNYQIDESFNLGHGLAVAWLKLGVASLVLAGLFSVLLVVARTRSIQDMIPIADFFHIALIVHVDLSVLIWFLAFAGMFWTLIANRAPNWLDKLALTLAFAGTLVITVAPFLGAGNPLMNNYVPMLDHPIFVVGLLVFAAGILAQILRLLSLGLPALNRQTGSFSLAFGVYLSAWVTLLALLAVLVSYLQLPADVSGIGFYEILYWGGGHILQYTHTILLLVAWMWIASACGVTLNIKPGLASLLFLLVALPVVYSFWIYTQFDVLSAEHRQGFTDLMKWGGLASAPIGLLVTWSLLRSSRCANDLKPIKASLYSSILLFAAGGVIGFMIQGANVVIPAHYHGSIVGVTLAFMGLAYHLLPRFGFTRPTSKMAFWQPYIYGGGQLLHIIGLAWSGGYGVKRKVAGATQGLENLPEVAGMALMGAGGGISIIGGVLFIIIMLKAFMKKERV